ncbi:MAG: hypothetical protein RIC19_14285 [Phaeodactylibacter sp.]|uniref:competence protein CoiA family protein n=1 Tax=Phaeodactylibacter sp. TaxID=1940289 RepID=UPI0032EBAFBF
MGTLPFALRDHQIVSIDEVSRGLSCGCTCLSCGAPMVAKKGQRQAHHFAHYKGADCAHGLETGLHLRIKALFRERRSIVVPALYLLRQSVAYFQPYLFKYDQVEEEPYVGQLYPDLILRKGQRALLLEIAVTHQTPPRKQQKLRKLGLPALEIDALSLYETVLQGSGPPDIRAFEYELQQGTGYKKWLFNPARQRAAFRLRKMAIVRPVKHRLYKGYHQYLTTDCPLGKRRWRSGYREGQAYANVIQDCMHCPRCAFLEYETEYVGYQEVPLAPVRVHCWGHLEQPVKPKPWQTPV